MKVKIIKTHPNAIVPFKAHDDDFCYDVVAVSEEEIAPNVWKYGIGLAFELCPPYEAQLSLSIDGRPRSSICKTGMAMANSVGTIDRGYRGEVSFVFYHIIPSLPRYKVGDKIAQIKLGCAAPMEFSVVNVLSDTDRGAKAYGSSGQ